MNVTAQLKQRIDDLEARVLELEGVLGMSFPIPQSLGLSVTLQQILGTLVSRKIMTREALRIASLPRHHHGVDHRADPENCGEAQLSKLRQRLRKFGIEVKNKNGIGWYLSAEEKSRITAASEWDALRHQFASQLPALRAVA